MYGCGSGCSEEVCVASGSGWNLWVWLLGVVVRRYIDFLILLIPTPLVSVLFYSIPTFCSFFKMFFFMNAHIIRALSKSPGIKRGNALTMENSQHIHSSSLLVRIATYIVAIKHGQYGKQSRANWAICEVCHHDALHIHIRPTHQSSKSNFTLLLLTIINITVIRPWGALCYLVQIC